MGIAKTWGLPESLRMVMQTALQALPLRRVVFCVRDPQTQLISGRLGLGEAVVPWLNGIAINLKPAPGSVPDLFTAICMAGADTVIDNIQDPRFLQRLPAWFGPPPPTLSLLLLPLVIKRETVALFYADSLVPGGLRLGDHKLALLRTLRNQAVMALRASD